MADNIFDISTTSTAPNPSSGNVFSTPTQSVSKAVSSLSSLFGVNTTPSSSPIPGVDVSVPKATKTTAAPEKNIFDEPPTVKDAVESISSKIGIGPTSTIPGLGSPSDDTAEGIVGNTITGLPKAALDEVGVGQIMDFLSTPEGKQAAANLSPSDIGTGILQGSKEAFNSFVSSPIASILGIFTGAKTYNLPGLGSISNIQQETKNAVANGENPYEAVLKAVPASIFDGLLVAGLSEKLFSPREQVIATGVKTNDLPSGSEGPAEKNFRQTKPVSTSYPIPREAFDTLKEQGITLRKYNPENPSYFRTTPMANGVLRGEIVQVKPSYFDLFKSKFNGDISKTPSNYTTTVYESESTPEQLQENLSKSPVVDTSVLNNIADNVRGSVSGNIEGLNKSQQTPLVSSEVKPLADQASNKYWNSKIQPSIDSGKAIVIGSDDLKDHFGKDYNPNNHPVYSQAANKIFERAVDTSPSDTVKFTVGGTGTGKSDFLVPHASEGFNGVVYDSTGFKYNDGLKKQIEYAKSKGKKIEIYGIIPDVERSRAYTFDRESRGEHPVSEAAFVRTHIGAIKTMIEAIHDGEDVHILDTRGAFTKEDIQKAEFEHNPLAILEKLEYNDEYVKRTIEKVTPETAKEIISRRPEGSREISEENRPIGGQEEKISRKILQERSAQLERVNKYRDRLKLRGADPVLVDAIITPRGTRAYGSSVGGNITLERVVEDFTEDHEVFHQVFQNMEKMRVFKNFDKAELIDEAKDLYGDLSESQLEEEMAKDFQQYVNEQENGKSTSFFGKIAEFFQRLFASIKRIFQNENDIKEFYRTVYSDRATQETEINNEMPKAFEQQVKEGVVDFRIQNATANFLDEVPVKDAFTDSGDLTLKTIQKLQGRTTVSKQYIYDLTNSGDIKQVERDLIRSVLDSLPDDQKVDVAQFAQDVKDELLPLKVGNSGTGKGIDQLGFGPRYENIALPEEIRGNVANYSENIYSSPIQTSAGAVHFQGVPEGNNYFGHTRIEDMIDTTKDGSQLKGTDYHLGPRRVIEVQSDLYQKGRLENEKIAPSQELIDMEKDHAEGKVSTADFRKAENEFFGQRDNEISKLSQYNDPTAHFRMVREEVKKAAEDDKTKLQFPTGETAMKIEGLGDTSHWIDADTSLPLKEANGLTHLKVGAEVNDGNSNWIITDVLGDGKFKAMPKRFYDRIGKVNDMGIKETEFDNTIETFDISGKVDTSNPIYRFYEKDLGRYLKNNYNAVPVTDDKGVTWMEVPIQKAYGDLPVPAFNERKETQTVEQLQNQRERFQQSLQAYNDNPELHEKAYPGRSQFYKDKIAELNQRIKDIKNPILNSGSKLEDAKTALKKAQERLGVKTEETLKQEATIKKENEAKAKKFGFTIPEYDNVHEFSYPDLIAAEEALKFDPGYPLMKYVNPRTGLLPEITPETPGLLGRKLAETLQKKGFTSMEEAQAAVDSHLAHTQAFSNMLDDKFDPMELSDSFKDTPVFQTEKERLSVPGAKPLETIVDQSGQTPIDKKIGAQNYFGTPLYVLEKVGLGDEARFEGKQYRGYLKELPKNIQKITDWAESLPKTIDGKPVKQRIFDYLNGANVDEDGLLKPDFLTSKEMQVATEIKRWLEQWADRLHIPQHQRLALYITHIFEEDFIKKEFDEDLAKIIDNKIPGEVYDPFLQKRLGVMGYKRDVWAALEAYAKRATRKVYMDPALEKLKFAANTMELTVKDYVMAHISQVNLRPTKNDTLADNMIKHTLKRVGLNEYSLTARPVRMLTASFRRIVSRATFGLNPTTALKVLTQGVNTYAKMGEKYTALGYAKLFNPVNLQELREEGVLNQNIANQDKITSATKKFWQKTDKVLFYMLTTADNINRGAAYLAAKSKYYDENTRLVSGDRVYKGDATEQKARDYAYDIAQETQFMYNPVNTPVAMGSDINKTLMQFQSFTTKETEFLGRMVNKKDYSGLLRYIGASLLLVYAMGKLFKTSWKDLVPVFRYLSGLPPILTVPYNLFETATGAPDQYGQIPSKATRFKNAVYIASGILPAGVQFSKVLKELNIQKVGGQTERQIIQGYIFGPSPSSTQNQINTVTKKATQTEQTKLDALDPSIVQPAQDAWTQVKKLGVGTPEADAVVNNLTDQEYTAYKLVKGADTEYWQGIDQKVLPIVQQASQLGFGTDAANSLVASMSDDEYKAYGQIKNALYGGKDLGADITGGQPVSKETFIQRIKAYADAIGTDPVTAFDDIFHGQIIKELKNNQIIVDRMSYQASQAVKKAEGGNNPSMKLDHAIPLEVGGTNETYNLQLIPTDEWAANTPVEDYLGNALSTDKIIGSQAREYAIRYKAGLGEPLSPKLQTEYKNKYNSQPLTFDQIKSLVGN